MRPVTSRQIRAVWFIIAMIPVMMLMLIAVLLMLAAASPIIIWAKSHGKHLKNPWSSRYKRYSKLGS